MRSIDLSEGIKLSKEERQRIDRRYDFILKLHGKNGRKALAIAEQPRIDNGYFGPESISWKVYENVMVAGMGALSGLFISVLEPGGAYGVGHHTTYYYDTIGRIRRSLHFFAGAVAGDTTAAEKVGIDLFRKHSHVTGEIPSTDEQFQANHVETLKFTYVVGWPHLWRAYKAFGDPHATDDDEREFYREQVMVCQLMGMPAGELPNTPESVEEWVRNAERELMAFTRPAQELTDFMTKTPMTPLYPNAILGIGMKFAIWAAIPLLTPYVRQICGLDHYALRSKIGTITIRTVARALRNPIIERLFIPYFGPETWGYMHNAIRHAESTGVEPMNRDPGLELQYGKRGTMTCPIRHTSAAAMSESAGFDATEVNA
ncbi:oxygenase MpaB family protein [Gordonia sp. CPCC 205333]|uniref:oxygenase MpaB family protein n=1 Tax=Gordonia sp. CPCC 205333 TaxID=3140790 RepID=UPI003AF39747